MMVTCSGEYEGIVYLTFPDSFCCLDCPTGREDSCLIVRCVFHTPSPMLTDHAGKINVIVYAAKRIKGGFGEFTFGVR